MRVLLRLRTRKLLNIFRRVIIQKKNVSVGKNLGFSIGTELYFSDKSKVKIGDNEASDGKCRIIASNDAVLNIEDNCYFNMNCFIGANKYISIGRHCVFGPGVIITDNDHKFEKNKGISSNSYNNGEVSIGSECWFGANVVIMKNTHIGDGCVIGAGCVIKGDVPANSIVTNHQELHIHQIEDR